jgi:quercetin 2,3-dioxygenase
MKKSIEKIILPPAPHMVGDGFRVHNFFPGKAGELKRMSPFFLIDYGSKINFPPTEKQRGVGVHPHRGFETVTLAYYGKVAHHDSSGNSGVIEEGGVQWMTAGSGVLHKEYHEKEFSIKGGLFQMVQLWVNLPAQYKMTQPKYQGFTRSDLARFEFENGVADIVAGEFMGVKGPAKSFSPLTLFTLRMQKGASLNCNLPENFNTGFIIVEGTCSIHSERVEENSFVLFKNDGTEIQVDAAEDVILLCMSGEPIDEPLVPYGPFLMNTEDEIREAYDDFRKGKFGVLED